jgi:hypothetical protein
MSDEDPVESIPEPTGRDGERYQASLARRAAAAGLEALATSCALAGQDATRPASLPPDWAKFGPSQSPRPASHKPRSGASSGASAGYRRWMRR